MSDQFVGIDVGGTKIAVATLQAGELSESGLHHTELGSQEALVGTGFPFKELERVELYLRQLKRLMSSASGVRRAGAAALDLAYVACGRLDAFWELGLSPWDMAAGILLIREAGGFVTDMKGGDAMFESGGIVAGNEAIHRELLTLIRA